MKDKKETTIRGTLFFLFAGLAGLTAIIAIFLRDKNIALLHSKGFIASEQKGIMLFAIAVVLIIALPTLFVLYLTAWKYRESNHKKTYHPKATHGKLFIAVIWILPTIFVGILASALVPTTHKLEPHKAIASDADPITIQVIAMRWKWLFIYPDQQIATVNFAQIPKNTPINFELTADDAPMSSFWVPNLAGQLYAMTGHTHSLNLIADKEGNYPGRSAEINGAGFQGMKFVTRVSTKDDFETWAQNIRSSSAPLDKKTYEDMIKPSENSKIASFVVYDDSTYSRVLMKYSGSHEHSESKEKESSSNNSTSVNKESSHDHSMMMEHEGSN